MNTELHKCHIFSVVMSSCNNKSRFNHAINTDYCNTGCGVRDTKLEKFLTKNQQIIEFLELE